ncbi:MAG: ABC transporter permease [Bacteroidales bacterium]|nr:ABC transporter permease [Bacteroidales bacterium]
MNFAYFIARHIAPGRTETYSRPVVRIAYVSIALGLALILASVAIVIGFKHSISDKVTGFAAPIRIVPFDKNESYQQMPLKLEDRFLKDLKANKEITHIQFTAEKAGVLKTSEQIQGVILKGVGKHYDWSYLKSNLVAGHLPVLDSATAGREVLISEKMARKLLLKVGDPVRIWFITGSQSEAIGRKLWVSGIYSTGLEEFDNHYIIGDIRQIQELNQWKSDQVGSIELKVRDFKNLNKIAQSVYESLPFNLNVRTITQEYPEIFSWLDLLNTNVVVILVLMILVASITMISTLLILIIERTNMVGILKTLGTNNRVIRKIFLYKAAYIIGLGMFWGNVIGMSFYYIQDKFRIFKLDPKSYYVSYVPVELHGSYWLLLNAGTFLICLLMLILPSYYITRIRPARALRYE